MADERQNQNQLVKHGQLVYKVNPSVSSAFPLRIKSKKPSKMGEVFMVTQDTGEVLAHGVLGFIEEQKVDSEEFVKIYLAGVRQYAQLSKAGATLFELVYEELSGKEAKDKDTLILNYFVAQRWREDLTRRTYERGMKELLEKEFLFRSVSSDMYFVNIRYIFNGDRLVLAKSYERMDVVTENQ
jgi:hypothetical protein